MNLPDESIANVVINQGQVNTSPPEEVVGVKTQQEIDRDRLRAGRREAVEEVRDLENAV